MSWPDTGLNGVLINRIRAQKYEHPLNVQLQVIPRALRYEDLIVRAETGSGKTLAYVLPILNRFYNEGRTQFIQSQDTTQIVLQALIVVPTRVLAQQVAGVFESFNFAVQMIQNTDNFQLSSPILISTPGKLFNFIQHKENHTLFSKIRFLILDEADKILSIRELEQLLMILPRQQRLSLLFSATITEGQYLQMLQKVSPKFSYLICKNEQEYNIPDKLNCYYLELPVEQKLYYLLRLLENTNDKVVVFTLTCNFTRYLTIIIKNLQETQSYLQNRKVFQLYGKMNAKQQLEQYEGFRNNENAVLITTDIAARGLDVESLNSVLQLDPPKSLDNFIHRCGRTARNGREGSAVALLTHAETGIVRLLQNKGLPIFAKKPSDVITSPSPCTLLSTPMEWVEEVVPHSQIKVLRKQEKKYKKQMQDYITRGVPEGEVKQKFQGVLDKLENELNPLLAQEQEQFAREKLVYGHSLTSHIRDLQVADLRLFNLAQQTFISYVRAYKEYELSIILNLANINLGSLAMSLGLLRLPKVQELKNYYLNFQGWEGRFDELIATDEKGKAIAERRKRQQEHAKENRLKAAVTDEMALLRLLNDGDISEGEFERRLDEIIK